MCALPKKTPPKSIESDLRPISLTPILSKELETHIVRWIWDSIDGSVDPTQYGSVKGCSTTQALVNLIHNWYQATDTLGQDVRTLFLDYSKAFDLINHNILLHKLEILGVPPLILKWIASFLCERKQHVRIANSVSPWNTLNGGVPQGTKLGPVLFILMIHDLRPELPTVKYVDDTTIYTVTKDPNTTVLQEAATYASDWSCANNMKVNASKTKLMNISFSKTKKEYPPIYINGVEIEVVNRIKVLGVFLESDLSWKTHVEFITKKASKNIFLLSQFKKAGMSEKDLLTMYITMIRSLLEYACPSWHTNLPDYLSDQIEMLQKRSLKVIYPKTEHYELALKTSRLTTLKDRRDSLCLKFFHRMSSPTDKLHYLLPPLRPFKDLRSGSRFAIPKCRTERFSRSLIMWALRQANTKH